MHNCSCSACGCPAKPQVSTAPGGGLLPRRVTQARVSTALRVLPSGEMGRSTTSLRLHDDLRDRLAEAAEAEGTTVTALERFAREGLAISANRGGPPPDREVSGGPRTARPGTTAGDHPSSRSRTGLTSTIGVPSSASRFRTSTLMPSIAEISTLCNPTGFGRSAERVLNTPRSGFAGSSRG